MAFDAVEFLAGLFRPERRLCPEDLPADWRELYEERAGILEFCANFPRPEAERRAMAETTRRTKRGKNQVKGLDRLLLFDENYHRHGKGSQEEQDDDGVVAAGAGRG